MLGLGFIMRPMAGQPDTPITEELRRKLRALREATYVAPAQLLRQSANIPAGLSAKTITNWMNGTVATARGDHLQFVLDAYRALPHYTFVDITTNERQLLQQLREQSGVGPSALLRGQRDVMPDGLSGRLIKSWLDGRTTRVRKDHLDWVIRHWRELANSTSRRINIRDEDVNAMQQERARTGVSGYTLLKIADNPPENLSVNMIYNWMNGEIRTARESDLAFVLALWRSLPDAPEPQPTRPSRTMRQIPANRYSEAVYLDDAIVRRLREQKDATGYGAQTLLNWARDNAETIPEDLNAKKIEGWLAGQIRHARQSHLDWVVAMYDKLATQPDRRITLTREHIAALERERERTGVAQTALLENAVDVPEGLSAAMITRWINGNTKTARTDFYDYVLSKWRALPDDI